MFGLVPSLPIVTRRSKVDCKPILELSDNDVALTEEVFKFAIVIKFWGTRPPLEVLHNDVSKSWGLIGRFIMGASGSIDICSSGLSSKVIC